MLLGSVWLLTHPRSSRTYFAVECLIMEEWNQ
jgi:hypothetical protein